MLAEETPDYSAACRLGRDEREGVVEAKARGVGALGDRDVDPAVVDVGAKAALLDADRAALGMVAENSARAAAAETRGGGAAFLGDNNVDRPIGADLQHIVVTPQIGVGLGMLHIGAIAPDAGEDRFAARRMPRDLARQGQQRQRV